jgi:hypothetical protein
MGIFDFLPSSMALSQLVYLQASFAKVAATMSGKQAVASTYT